MKYKKHCLVVILSLILSLQTAFAQGQLINLCKDNKWGYLNLKNEIKVPFIYSEAKTFNNGLAVVCSKEHNYKCGAINKKGEVVIPLIYDTLSDFSGGLALFQIGSEDKAEYGIINKNGRIIIQQKKNFIRTFNNGLAAAEKNGKWGYIDKNDNVVIPYQYDFAWSFNQGFAAVQNGKNYGLINKKGEVVLPFEYDSINEIKGNKVALCKALGHEFIDACGVIDLKGNQILPFDFIDVMIGQNNTYSVHKKNSKWELRDKNNTPIVNKEFYLAYPFKHNMALVCEDFDKCGYINLKGKYVIPPRYQALSPIYHNKIIAAMKNNKWGIIYKSNKIIIPFLYDWTGLVY